MNPVVVMFDDLEGAQASTYQWWLHAMDRMAVDSTAQTVRITRNQAQLDILLLAPDHLSITQTDQFTLPPEGDAKRYPNQWHLTAQTTSPARECRFLTVLLPHRTGQEDPTRKVRLLSGEGYLGAEVVAQGKRHVVVFRTGATRPNSRWPACGCAATSARSPGTRAGSPSGRPRSASPDDRLALT